MRAVKVLFILSWLLLLVPSTLLNLDVTPRNLLTAGTQA